MAQRYFKGGVFKKVVFEKNGKGWSFRMNFQPLADRVQKVQAELDQMVWQDMQKYMPIDSGMLRSQTNALNVNSAGTGEVWVYPPESDYGHYQYEGKVYVDPVYGFSAIPITQNGVLVGFRSRLGVPKVPSDRNLKYTDPNAQRHWDEVAIANNRKKWEKFVLEELNK